MTTVKDAGVRADEAPAPDDDAFTDKLLEEVSLEGVPTVREFHQLSRRDRANLTDQLAALLPGITQYEKAMAANAGKPASTADAVKLGAQALGFLADVEDLLATLAIDEAEMRAWAQSAGDAEILAVFARFVRTFNSGEASSSSI